jgi:hypothetical protein
MNTRMRAETTRVCDAGLAAYLADQHSAFRLRSFSRGMIAGTALAIPAWFIASYSGLNPSLAILPFVAGAVGGSFVGLTQADRNDSSHTADFDSVCAQLDKEDSDSEKTESESDA